MTFIDPRDVDAQMAQQAPRAHRKEGQTGGSKVAMATHIRRGVDSAGVDRGHGRRGTEVYSGGELPQQGFYGSSKVISLNEQPPLPEEVDPQAAQAQPPQATQPPAAPTPGSFLARFRRPG